MRVDLCAVLDSLISAEALLVSFVQSANEGKTVSDAQWKRKWAAVATVIRKDYLYIPDSERDLAAIDSLLAAGHFILHHSPAYSKAYHPHYRIISSDLLATCLPPAEEKTGVSTHERRNACNEQKESKDVSECVFHIANIRFFMGVNLF